MTPDAATPKPRSRWRRIGWVLILAAGLGVLGYGAWQHYDFREAQKEAKALGWEWKYDDPIDAIRKDWKAAFRQATWIDGTRYPAIWRGPGLERDARLLRRLAPKSLSLRARPALKDLSPLKDLSALQVLDLSRCTGLTNLDALKGLPALRVLNLSGCTGLRNVDGLKNLPSLQWLDLSYCDELTNLN